MYIVTGAAGHFDGLDSANTPYPSYTQFVNDTLYGYSKVTFHNRTHCKYLDRNQAIHKRRAGERIREKIVDTFCFASNQTVTHEFISSATNNVLDSATLFKQH